jgi:hypothetical protein
MSLSFIAPDSITHLAAEEFCADDRFHHEKRSKVALLRLWKEHVRARGRLVFLRNRLWRQLVPREQRHGMICRACIERRLGRQLMPDDFRKATDDESIP